MNRTARKFSSARRVTMALLSIGLILGLPSPAGAEPTEPGTGDQGSMQQDRVIAPPPRPSSAAAIAASPTGTFTFTFDSPDNPWSASDLSVLQSWTQPGSPEMTAVQQVAGRPPRDIAVNIALDPGLYTAGTYGIGSVTMRYLYLDVFLHELNHAIHDEWIVSNSVWEEGMARAAEDEELRLLSLQGIEIYTGDPTHAYTYDVYYDLMNVPDLGVQNGSIYGYGEPAFALLRSEESGYGFGKMLIESPSFLSEFNAALFHQPDGNLTDTQLVSLAAGVKSTVEGQPFSRWYAGQHIYDSTPPTGCRMFQRINQWVADFFCRDVNGAEVPQVGATVTYSIYNAAGAEIFTGQGVTTSYGWVWFDETPFDGYTGRVKVVATGISETGSASSTFYRQAGPEAGVFGIVTNASTGSVVFSSPSGSFSPVTADVTDGAFYVPNLSSIRGTIQATFTGGGLTATRTFTKAESPYALQFTGQAARTAKIAVISGNKQRARVGTYFSCRLRVRVVTAAGRPAEGVEVKFAAPSTGARATFGGRTTVTVRTDSRGYATSPRLKAGKTAGTYPVKVTADGFGTAAFKLTNKA